MHSEGSDTSEEAPYSSPETSFELEDPDDAKNGILLRVDLQLAFEQYELGLYPLPVRK